MPPEHVSKESDRSLLPPMAPLKTKRNITSRDSDSSLVDVPLFSGKTNNFNYLDKDYVD